MKNRNTAPSFRRAIKERCGDKCYICGASPVEYHHVIPLWKGGEDTVGNFMALCSWHHMVLHGAQSTTWNNRSGGRKRQSAKVGGYKYILDDYFCCRIGTKKCKDAMGLAEGTHIADRPWVKDYMSEKGIVAYRNNVDILKKNGKPMDGKRVGWVQYSDGRKEVYYWDAVNEHDR